MSKTRNTVTSNAAAIAAMQATMARLVSLIEGKAAPAPEPVLSVPATLTSDIAAPVVTPIAPVAPRAVAPAAGRTCCPSCQTPIKRLTRANVVVRDVAGAAAGTIVPPFTGTAFLKALPAVPVQLRDGRSGTISGEQLFGILNSRRQDPMTGRKARAVSVPGFLRGEQTHPDVSLLGGPILRSESDDELAARVFRA
jgi:hypothetical protein